MLVDISEIYLVNVDSLLYLDEFYYHEVYLLSPVLTRPLKLYVSANLNPSNLFLGDLRVLRSDRIVPFRMAGAEQYPLHTVEISSGEAAQLPLVTYY